jgi:hypothetical protein
MRSTGSIEGDQFREAGFVPVHQEVASSWQAPLGYNDQVVALSGPPLVRLRRHELIKNTVGH